MAAPAPNLSLPSRPPPSNPPPPHAEISLSGQHSNWDLYFASTANISNSIKFTKDDSNPDFPGIGHRTLGLFGGVEGRIKFRDSRTLTTTSHNANGTKKSRTTTIWASFQIRRYDYSVVRHEPIADGTWITLIRLRPGYTLNIQQALSPAVVNSDTQLRAYMLKLWTEQMQIRRMPYLQIIIRDHDTYPPWKILLQRNVLGPVITTTTRQQGSTSALPARLFPAPPQSTPMAPAPAPTPAPALPSAPVPGPDDGEDLIDLFFDDAPAPAPAPTPAPEEAAEDVGKGKGKAREEEEPAVEAEAGLEAVGEEEPTEQKSGEEGPGEGGPVDPFANVWAKARGR